MRVLALALLLSGLAATAQDVTHSDQPRESNVFRSANKHSCESEVLLAPTTDQTIVGSHILWNKGRTWLGADANANLSFVPADGLNPNSYLFNLQQNVTTGKNYPNPSVLMGIYGGITPTDGLGNLFGFSALVQDNVSPFHVDNLGAVGGTSIWFGTAGVGNDLSYQYGVIGAAYGQGDGNTGQRWGVRGLATNDGSGTASFNKGGTFGSGGSAGTITNDATVFIEPPITGATFTNPHEGLHIEDQTNSGILPDAYAVNVLGGKVDLGPGATIIGTHTPLSASDRCDTGTITYDPNFIYVCVATNTWKRTAISTW